MIIKRALAVAFSISKVYILVSLIIEIGSGSYNVIIYIKYISFRLFLIEISNSVCDFQQHNNSSFNSQ